MNLSTAFQLTAEHSEINSQNIPLLLRVRQKFPRLQESDIPTAVRRELQPFLGKINAGARIAITGSSRGIPNLAAVIREAVNCIRGVGGEPFVVPGMGSHGGATPEGQIEVLKESNGITQASVGAPVRSSMEVIQVGITETDFPVYQDKNAYEADGVLVINRVKPHTGFTGPVESGLCKMLVIGLGKQAGASRIHQQSLRVEMQKMILDASKIILESTRPRFIGGLALLDNAFEETARVVGVAMDTHEQLVAVESALLKEAYDLLPRIPFADIDTLIVEEMGKNISGLGMDSNVIGTKPGLSTPRIGAIYVRNLTEETHGNATGIGAADVIPRRLLAEIDLHSTYMNAYTAKNLGGAKMPLMVEDDLQALQVCLSTRPESDPATVRLVWIKNTSCLGEFYASSALIDEIQGANLLPRGHCPRIVNGYSV